VAAENNRATLCRFVSCATIYAAVFHPPSLALSLARATPVCENMGTHTPSKPLASIEPNHAPD